MEQNTTDQLSNIGLEADSEVRRELGNAAKWSKFLAITVFAICGLVLLFALAASSAISSLLSRFGSYGSLGQLGFGALIGVLVFVMLIVAAVYYFLFNFSAKTKAALATENGDTLNAGVFSLKIFFIISTIAGVLSLINTLYALSQTF